MDMGEFISKVAAICSKHNCSVTSWIRTHQRNENVGGKSDSLHLWGLAIDIVPDDWKDLQNILTAIRNGKLHYKVHKGHIHIQTRPGKP